MIDHGADEKNADDRDEPERPTKVAITGPAGSSDTFTFSAGAETWASMVFSGLSLFGSNKEQDCFLRALRLRLCGRAGVRDDSASTGTGQLTLPDGSQFHWHVVAADPRENGAQRITVESSAPGSATGREAEPAISEIDMTNPDADENNEEDNGENREELATPDDDFRCWFSGPTTARYNITAPSCTLTAPTDDRCRMRGNGCWTGDEEWDRFLQALAPLCDRAGMNLRDSNSTGTGEETLPDGRRLRWQLLPADAHQIATGKPTAQG